jgi:hypothetical protein
MDAAILDRLFSRALRRCKFFPKVSEILEPLASAQINAAPEAAEEAWERVLEIRRADWNPDIPGPFRCALARLSDRVRQAARAAGVFRDFESVDALHTWAKKRFVESFVAYGEREQDQFLLPGAELKDLLADVAEKKALPPVSPNWAELHARGLEYSTKKVGTCSKSAEIASEPEYRKPSGFVDFEARRAELRAQAQRMVQKFPLKGQHKLIEDGTFELNRWRRQPYSGLC